MTVTREIIDEFQWWKNIDDLFINPIRFSKYDREIYSDASLSGWGVCCNVGRAHGYWKKNKKYLSIIKKKKNS